MHTSHDFIATKTCPSSFRTTACLRPKKCGRGGCELVWSAGRVRIGTVRGGKGQKILTRAGLWHAQSNILHIEYTEKTDG